MTNLISPIRYEHQVGLRSQVIIMNNIIYHYPYFTEFFKSVSADGFSLEFESQQASKISRTLLSILVDLNNHEVWMISTCPRISKPSSPFTNILKIVPNVSTTIGITVYGFLFSSKVYVFISIFNFFYLYSVVCRDGKIHYSAGAFFYYHWSSG